MEWLWLSNAFVVIVALHLFPKSEKITLLDWAVVGLNFGFVVGHALRLFL